MAKLYLDKYLTFVQHVQQQDRSGKGTRTDVVQNERYLLFIGIM